MTKTISIKKNEINFQFIKNANYWCWQGYIDIFDVKVEIEIDSEFHKKEVNWKSIEEFLIYISEPNRIKKLSEAGNESITKTGQDFFSNSKEIENWKMTFKNSILYFGKSEKMNFSYGIVYDFYEQTEQGIEGDPYGLYFVKMENEQYVSSERHQV